MAIDDKFGDIKAIVASEFAKATVALKRGRQMVINAEGRRRRAIRAMKALNMEVIENGSTPDST